MATSRLLFKALRGLAWLLSGGALLLVLAWRLSWPEQPDGFYQAPAQLAAQPGLLLRAEPFSRDVPAGARGWRMLYTTRRGDDSAAVASALILARPADDAGAAHPLLVWAHGTTGLAAGCAPSLLQHPFGVPALAAVLRNGWVLLQPDYIGLGSAGGHPYLIGEEEARSVLDAIRAAHQLDELGLSDQTVVWGHSQGGHAALWTGMLAPSYAPELKLGGVAALAPASDLVELLRAAQDDPIVRVVSSYLVQAYGAVYPDVRFDQVVRPGAAWLARDMTRRCLTGAAARLSMGEAQLLRRPIFRDDPGSGAFGQRLRQNSPAGPIAAPLLIAQGQADEVVPAAMQDAYVQRLRQAGQALDYRGYAGRDHQSLMAPDSPLNADLLNWTGERFERKPE